MTQNNSDNNFKNIKEKKIKNEKILIKLHDIVGDDIIENLTGSELRQLKLQIKKGNDIKKSLVLKNIAIRCPSLKHNIKDIINGKKMENKNHKKRKLSPIKKIQTTKRTKKSDTKIESQKKFEILGSTDTDTDTDNDGINQINEYQRDGFVVNDSDDDEYIPNLDDDEDEENEDEEDDDDDDDDEDKEDTNNFNENNMDKKKREKLNEKIQLLRKSHQDNIVTIQKIAASEFNKEDLKWFYRNIKRLQHMQGKEKYDLEDKIERRFLFLKYLQENNIMMVKNYSNGYDRDLTNDIMSSSHPDHVKQILLQKLYSVTNESIEEYQKTLYWLDTILSIPTEIKSSKQNIKESIMRLYDYLYENMYGMDHIIQQILQAVCTILSDPDNNGYILTLVGPPGVGKTTISSLISKSIGMGFGQISCGSINDQATITGHGSTYIGSKPGIFTQQLIHSGQLDNVILLDEMDKLPDKKMIPILLHVLDKSQNNRFKDAFCPEIDVNLSKNLYIVAVNSVDPFDDALKDRLKIINVNGYNVEQKCQICLKHVIPKIMKRTGININIDPAVIKNVINNVSPGISGVRDIERYFGDIYEKLLVIKHMDTKFVNKFYKLPLNFNINKLSKIDKDLIEKLNFYQKI